MKGRIVIAVAVMLSLIGVTAPGFTSGPMPATGEFSASIDFSTLTLTPVGANCLLEVEGQLDFFTGTLEGRAQGVTRALVLASCEEALGNPPGTFRDVFQSTLEFDGTVNGEDASADITYQGITAVGGAIDAQMHLSNGLKGVLNVDATVVVGGSYDGFVMID